MTSLSARITALLIVAILTVVGLATLAASRALQPPNPETTIEPVARQIHVLAELAARDPGLLSAAGGAVSDRPAKGAVLERMSIFLSHAMTRTGPPRKIIVSREGGRLIASVALSGGGWLLTPVPDPSPPEDRWLILGIWIAMIVVGSVAVSWYAARRLSRPIELMEDAASRIGTDATLPPVPETGPAEVRATARALNRLSERLTRAMESRMRLVAAAGHDLRTPMTRMRLRAEFIPDDEERARWLADLEELDQIADSAIRLVREEAGGDLAEPLRLDQMVQTIAGEMTEIGQEMRLDPAPPLTVTAAPLALKRALRNLMANAATHGGGGTVSLQSDGPQAVITIRDLGPGIPGPLIDRVFEPFFRVDPARQKGIPGAGLGLAIAREILARFGGSLAIRNHPDGGLEQVITLPAPGP
ncbi:ATP-binding protein [Pseudogemmobacter bohemicus]|uniref:ATP-binding protein n=1 Tax=Pseudogemmobacter bohemicus TaxID=2250708 RepID=UPI000DD4686E|nr:ATP-binding protein [Pseudogemmobacter bohemicus]